MPTRSRSRLRKYFDGDSNTILHDLPELKNCRVFGPRLLLMIGWHKSRPHFRCTTIETWMGAMLQVSVSRGYLAKLCNGTNSALLAAAHEGLKQAIPERPQTGSNESSLKNNGRKNWIWCLTKPLLTVFHITISRSRTVLEELIGAEFDGSLHSVARHGLKT